MAGTAPPPLPPIAASGGATTQSVVPGLNAAQLALKVWVPRYFGAQQMVPMTIGDYLANYKGSGKAYLSADSLQNYVQALVQAGYLSSNAGPSGYYDPASIMTALGKALVFASAYNTNISQLLAQQGKAAAGAQAAAGAPPPSRFFRGGTATVGITTPAEVQTSGDAVAQQMVGRHLTAQQVQGILGIINPEEYAKGAADVATAQATQAAYAQAVTPDSTAMVPPGAPGVGAPTGSPGALPSVPSGAPLGLAEFMAAVRTQESGGNYSWSTEVSSAGARGAYQFEPSTYANAAKEAGVDPNDTSAAAQDRVAAHLMTQYFHKYGGNWGAVAAAWYGGEGGASAYLAGKGGAPQKGGPTIDEYARSVLSKMAPPSIAKPAPAAAAAPIVTPQAVPTTPATAPDGTALNPLPTLPTLAPGTSGSLTVGGPSSFQTQTATGYPVTDTVLPPTATIVANPESPEQATADFLMNHDSAQYQVENLSNVFAALNKLMTTNTGAARGAGTPVEMAGK